MSAVTHSDWKTVNEPLTRPRSTGDLLPKRRLEAFADGALAIVITILVSARLMPAGS